MTTRFRRRVAAIAILTAVAGGVTPLLAQAAARFDLPAQPLGDSLRAIASQTNTNVLFDRALVENRTAPALRAELTARQAIDRILQGSGITTKVIDEKTVTIVHTPTAPPFGLKEEQIPTKTGDPRRDSSNPRDVKEAQKTSFWERFRMAELDRGADPADGGPAAQAGEEQSAKVKLEEIVVTATKRVESIQDVPLSIAAITAEEIDRRGMVTAEDYLRGIPGVNQTTDNLGQSIIIRGIETSPFQQNSSSGTTVATYFGETSTTNSAGLSGNTNIDLKLVDIERVEVLRGPQGTAFGNSSLGGTVRTIPVPPKLDRFEGKVRAAYSMTSGSGDDNNMIQAVGNVPLLQDRLALRATAYRFEDSGFYRNVAASDTDFQNTVVVPWGAQAFAVDKDHLGTARSTGGRIAALFQATPDLKFSLSYLTQKTEVDGQAQANAGRYDQAMLRVAPEHVFRGQQYGLNDSDIDLANIVMEYNLGWGNLLATYSHTKSGTTISQPAQLNLPISSFAPSDHREHSGEVRLATQLEGAWNFLAGVYAEKLEDEGLFNIYWFGDPDLNFLPNPPDRLWGEGHSDNDLKQKAAFTEISWSFLPGFTLTGGARAYDYTRNLVSSGVGILASPVTSLDGDASGTSYRGNLSYKLNDNALVYAGWSQGFRLGTPQIGLPPGACDIAPTDGRVDGTSITIDSTKFVGSDAVDNYEIGSKVTSPGGRLTMAADVFRIDWTGVPFRTNVACGASAFAYVANAGQARSQGVEFQSTFYVSSPLRVDVGGSWIDAKLTQDAPGVGGFDGDRLPGSPKVNANLSLQYEFSLGGHEAFLRADSIYVGSFYGDVQQSAQTQAGDYVKLDASARVTVDALSIDLFVRNLTNRDDYTFRGIVGRGDAVRGDFFGYRLRPRTIGLQLGYNF